MCWRGLHTEIRDIWVILGIEPSCFVARHTYIVPNLPPETPAGTPHRVVQNSYYEVGTCCQISNILPSVHATKSNLALTRNERVSWASSP